MKGDSNIHPRHTPSEVFDPRSDARHTSFRTVPYNGHDTSSPSKMLARQALGRLSNATAAGVAPAGARNMATLREIEMRLKSVRNIEKITKVRSSYMQLRGSPNIQACV